jgi:hypothetical protein
VEKSVLEALVGVDCLTGNLPTPDRFRSPKGLRVGWTKIAHRPRTIEEQRCKRCSAMQIESHSCDNCNRERVGGRFSLSIKPWSRADNLEPVV